MKKTLLALAVAAALTSPAYAAKNVILMISDGASWGAWDAGNYYTYGSNAGTVYSDFTVKLGMTTTPLNTSSTPTMNTNALVSYDPSKAWSTTPTATGNANGPFSGYDYIAKNVTDSAAAGTAIASGQKSYNNAINWSNMNEALPYITQMASAQGKATGVVSSVQFNHATPASFGAQDPSRNNYTAIANEMINNPSLNLVMGTGHPMYNANGQSQTASYNYITQTDYNSLSSGNAGWQYIETKTQFENLAAGGTVLAEGERLFGMAQNNSTLQQGRSAGTAQITGVPTLETMTTGALNALSGDKDGMFVMIEGGAVDWAAHANQKDRLVEEQHDFNKSVEAVKSWVQQNSSWEETLLIVTTDHGNASPMGLGSDTVAFQGVANNGQGVMPDFRFWGGNHKNEIVPLYAMGAGADDLLMHVEGSDAGFNQYVNTDGRFGNGSYVSNDDLFKTMNAAIAPVPEPSSIAMLLAGLGMLGMVARRRRAA
ncbi:alkaline phosphatase [Uliginosibacterium flavum]|uniref:Alkaline phosphatase n=1 Tax=Uliginosibacterium flavum TaxID=1396831 RepID=A0ABV2TI89_9RHOO